MTVLFVFKEWLYEEAAVTVKLKKTVTFRIPGLESLCDARQSTCPCMWTADYLSSTMWTTGHTSWYCWWGYVKPYRWKSLGQWLALFNNDDSLMSAFYMPFVLLRTSCIFTQWFSNFVFNILPHRGHTCALLDFFFFIMNSLFSFFLFYDIMGPRIIHLFFLTHTLTHRLVFKYVALTIF